jgi:predicted dehydrogenase
MKDLGVAIVGCRAVAPLHAQAVSRAIGARVALFCDLDPEPAEELAKVYGGDVETDYARVLARDDVDVVTIVTPDELHAQMAIAAAEAGKHALVEKPIAMDLSEMQRIIDAGERCGVRIMCAQSQRFRAKFRAVREVVASGRIGEPVFARIGSPASPFWTKEVWAPAGWDRSRPEEWLLIHNGMHQFDFLSLLFDSFPAEVYAVSHPGQQWLRVHEYAAVSIRFENGCMALSEENRIMQPPRHPFHADFMLVGTRGSIDASDRDMFAVCTYDSAGLQFPGAHVTMDENEDAFLSETQALVDAVRGDREPEIPLSFTRSVLTAVMAACRSMETGTNVSVGGAS